MLTPFELFTPVNLDEAIRLLLMYGDGCKILAGGTDVLAAMHAGSLQPRYIVDIKNILELQGETALSKTGLTIPALTTHNEIEFNPDVGQYYTALKDGVSRVGSVQTRMRGTIGGNICNAVPSGDSLGPLLALDARLSVYGPGGWRDTQFEEFFISAKKTVLQPGELLCQIELPPPRSRFGSAYIKHTRRKAMDLALIGVTVCLGLDEHGYCDHARIALSTAAPVPIRSKAAEEYLYGKKIDESKLTEAAELAALYAKPRSSWRSSAEYRLKVIKALLPRAAKLVIERIADTGFIVTEEAGKQ